MAWDPNSPGWNTSPQPAQANAAAAPQFDFNQFKMDIEGKLDQNRKMLEDLKSQVTAAPSGGMASAASPGGKGGGSERLLNEQGEEVFETSAGLETKQQTADREAEEERIANLPKIGQNLQGFKLDFSGEDFRPSK